MNESTPLRSDAEARRRRLIEAASRLFADEGLDVPMQRIAQEAGVGVGTLYRRFPDRESLLVAVVVDNLGRMRDGVRAALASEGRAWDVFISALTKRDQKALSLRGQLTQVPEIARIVDNDPAVHAVQAEVLAALTDVVDAAKAEGSMREDVGSGDVLLLLYLIGRRAVPSDAPPEASARLRALILDALSTGPHAPLPGEPVAVRDIWGSTR